MGRVLLYIIGAFVLVVGAEIGVLYMMFHGHVGGGLSNRCAIVSLNTPDQRIAACTELIAWDRAHGKNTYMPLNARGNAYIDEGDLEGLNGDARAAKTSYRLSARDFDRILHYNPNNATVLNGRCWARALGGEPLQLALDDCNRAIAIAPQANVLQSRALVYLKMGRLKESIADSDSSLAQQPQLAQAFIVRGIAEVRAGNRAAGNADIARAGALFPQVVPLYKSYGLMPK